MRWNEGCISKRKYNTSDDNFHKTVLYGQFSTYWKNTIQYQNKKIHQQERSRGVVSILYADTRTVKFRKTIVMFDISSSFSWINWGFRTAVSAKDTITNFHKHKYLLEENIWANESQKHPLCWHKSPCETLTIKFKSSSLSFNFSPLGNVQTTYPASIKPPHCREKGRLLLTRICWLSSVTWIIWPATEVDKISCIKGIYSSPILILYTLYDVKFLTYRKTMNPFQSMHCAFEN